MFGIVERAALRERLVHAAQQHPDVVGAALLGSAARGEEDRWSDIDLALCLGPDIDPAMVADAWTAVVAQTEVVVDYLDIRASGALYRVLLLGSTLQVDLSFWPHDQSLRPGAPVEVLFGRVPIAPGGSTHEGDESMAEVRMVWLFALHARSALERGRIWQALWMLEGIRNIITGLYCRRLALPTSEGRGADGLPPLLIAGLEESLPATMDVDSLQACFSHLVGLLLTETQQHGPTIPEDLARVLAELSHDSHLASVAKSAGDKRLRK